MPRRASPLAVLLLLLVGSAAYAEDTISLQFSGAEIGPIGIDNCASLRQETISIDAAVTYDDTNLDRAGVLRILHYTDAVCDRASGLETCAGRLEGSLCGCAAELTDRPASLSTSFTLGDFYSEDELCTDDAPSQIEFIAELYYPAEADLSAKTLTADSSVSIAIDRTRPSRPGAAPTVQPAEGALVVSVEAVDGASEYEVCVLEANATPDVSADDTNDALRAGYICKGASGLPSSSYRYEGLQNDVNYLVTYAVYDSAGNRSANSDPAEGLPAEQLDFAEVYARYSETGERGGCRATPGAAVPALPWAAGLFGLGLVLAIRRRRS